MKAMTDLIRRHPLAAYFAFAYAISWVFWLPNVMAFWGWTAPISPYIPLLGAFGPMLAAVIVSSLTEGSAGRSRLTDGLTRWRVGWWWLAALGPLGLMLFVALGVRLSGSPFPVLGVTTFALVQSVMHGFGEEIGWRGFALPRLQARHNALMASVVLSLLWAGWHIPLLISNETYRQMGAFGLVGWFFSLLIGSVLLTWLFNGSGGSVLIVAVFHTLLDVSTIGHGPVVANIVGALVTVWGVAALALTGADQLSKTGKIVVKSALTGWSRAKAETRDENTVRRAN
jgi:membrane protease YdiL (CAAX protease family)